MKRRPPGLAIWFAQALSIDPILLFVDFVTTWRANPSDRGLVKSRPSDLVRLYRLGYSIDPGDFRELPAVYGTDKLALCAAAGFNVTRSAKAKPRIEAVLTYVRSSPVLLRPDFPGADSAVEGCSTESKDARSLL